MKSIYFSPPLVTEEDISAVTNVLRSGWITTGNVNRIFAEELKKYVDATSLVLTNSATAALFLALKMMGIGAGDEVITTAYTFAATANAIYHTGAKIVLADVMQNSFYIDPQEIYKNISPRTKAIIPVDFSTASSIVLDRDILKKNFTPNNKYQEALDCPLILIDAAHALGSRKIDSSVDMIAYSFHAVKNITTAEGGALAINSFGNQELDDLFLKALQYAILHGQDRSAKDKLKDGQWEYDIVFPGYKFNMPDISAALGLSQFRRYESTILPKRRQLFHYYIELLENDARMILDEPNIFEYIDLSSCHLFPLRIRSLTEERRNRLISYCHKHQVFVNVHYKPLTMMTVAFDYQCNQKMPYSYHQYCNEISLPLHVGMTFDDVALVVDVLIQGLNNENCC